MTHQCLQFYIVYNNVQKTTTTWQLPGIKTNNDPSLYMVCKILHDTAKNLLQKNYDAMT